VFNQWNAVDTAITAICLSVFPSVCPFTCVHDKFGNHVMTVRYRDVGVILVAVGRGGLESERCDRRTGFQNRTLSAETWLLSFRNAKPGFQASSLFHIAKHTEKS